MIKLSELKNIASFIGFSKEPSEELSVELSSDTRSYKSPQTFLAITGEKFNAVNFVNQVIEKGCQYIIYTDTPENETLILPYLDMCTFIKTIDSITFLQEFTHLIGDKFKAGGGKLIGVSGSNGKTTTKEMLFHLLKNMNDNTICTQKNNNNHIGVPLTLLQINQETDYAIIELGSNHPGEIKLLCEIANPNIGITTNIGDTHLEFFENQANVFLEEGYLYHHMQSKQKEKTSFFVNEDDQYLQTYDKREDSYSYGFNGRDYQFEINKNTATVKNGDQRYTFSNSNITGNHNFYNLCLAFIVAREITDYKSEDLLKLCENFKPTENRSQWIKKQGVEIFLDAYNANPSSMRAAVSGFMDHVELNNQSCLILGDMNELGNNAAKFHQDIGEELKSSPAGRIIFVGRFAADYNAGCGGKGSCYNSIDELKSEFSNSILNNFKYIFIKGSRSLQLEQLLDIN